MRGNYILRILAVVVLIAIMIGGGFMAYQTGLSQGYAQRAAAAGNGSGATQVAPVPFAPGYYPVYPGYWRGWGWGFPFFPFIGLFWIFGLFLVFGLFRRAWWGRHPMGPHGGYWYGNPPPGYGPPQQGQPGQPEGEKPADQ